MRNKGIPIVRGFIVGNLFKFYCSFCDTFHTHGWVSGSKNQHRVAHCNNYYGEGDSPFIKTGYYIKSFTKGQTKILSGYVDKNLKYFEGKKELKHFNQGNSQGDNS